MFKYEYGIKLSDDQLSQIRQKLIQTFGHEYDIKNDTELLNNQNIANAAINFLGYYQTKFGYDFTKTKLFLQKAFNDELIAKAICKTNMMYQKYHYND